MSFSFVLCNKYQINSFVLGVVFYCVCVGTTDVLIFEIEKKKKQTVEITAIFVKWNISDNQSVTAIIYIFI